MPQFPSTSSQLLVSLGDPANAREWSRFVQLYEPALMTWLRKRGLQQHDAEDCVQKVLVSVMRSLSTFQDDSAPASFRRWLQRVARNEFVNHVRKSAQQPKSYHDSLVWGEIANLALESNSDQFEKDIEYEYYRHMFRSAAEEVRSTTQPATWAAFWRTVVLGEPTALVALETGLSVGSVYVAKGRVLQRIQRAVQAMEEPS